MRMPSLDILRIDAETPHGECTATVRNMRGWPIRRTSASVGYAVTEILTAYDRATGATNSAFSYAANDLLEHLDPVAYHVAELSARMHELIEAESDLVLRWRFRELTANDRVVICNYVDDVFECIFDICYHAVKLQEQQAQMLNTPPSSDWRSHRLWTQGIDSLQWALGMAAHAAATMGCPDLITDNTFDCKWLLAFDPLSIAGHKWVGAQTAEWWLNRHHRVFLLKAAMEQLVNEKPQREIRIAEMVNDLRDRLDILIRKKSD